MTTKRFGETSEDVPVEKRGRLEEADDDLDAELDDEVEKELREFEQLRSSLIGDSSQNNTLGKLVENGHMELENGSDMEVDEELEQETADRNKKISPPHQDRPNISKRSLLDDANIRVLPDTFAEENLRGDDLIETSSLTDGEEACLNLDLVQLYRPSRVDPLNPDYNKNPVKPENQTARSEKCETQPLSSEDQESPKLRRRKSEEEDPDYPSPGKVRSQRRRSAIRSKSHHEHQDGKSFGSSKSSALPIDSQKPAAQSERLKPQLMMKNGQQSPPKPNRFNRAVPRTIFPDTNHTRNAPFKPSPYVPKELFVDPVLGNATNQRSAVSEPEKTFEDPVLKTSVPSKSTALAQKDPVLKAPKSFSNGTSLTRHIPHNPKPSCAKAHQVERALPETLELNPSPKQKQPIGGTIHSDEPYAHNIQQTSTTDIPLQQPITKRFPLEKPLKPAVNLKEPITAQVTQSCRNPKPPKHHEYMDFLKKAQELADTAPPQPIQASRQPAEPDITIDITDDPPAEYCAIELVMRRRFENSFLLDDEKMDLMEAGRPGIWCHELHPYMTFYKTQTCLAACNELKKFFCWICLFFSNKTTWSVTCHHQSEAVLGKEITKHQQSPVHQESIKHHKAWVWKKNSSIIKTLLKNNFVDGTWTDEDQEAIIMKGRPRPILNSKTNIKSTVAKKAAFENFYGRFNWISGCSEKFYCWPCVLFTRKPWTYDGTITPAHDASLAAHETNPKHIDACLKLGKWELDLKKRSKAELEQTKKKRDFLQFLVEVICAEKKKINNAEITALDYVDTLKVMSGYSRTLKAFMDDSKMTVAQTVAKHLTVILDSVDYFIKIEILEELKNANFISLIFDHSSGQSYKAVLSVIARYVDGNGKVHERFVKLLNVGYNTPSTTLLDEFFQIIAELQCRSTLVGFTYDGYLLKPGDIPEFNAKVQKLCPDAKFFHYREHNFKRIVKQTLSHEPVCRRVLQVVEELANFFENTPGARKGLLDIIKSTDKSERKDCWRSPDFIKTVFVYYAVIVEIMNKICKNAKHWKVRIVVQATNFLDFFKDPTNRFFVTVIARIYIVIDDLTRALEDDVGVEETKPIAGSTALKLQKLGRNFDSVLEAACSHLEARDKDKTRKEMSTLRDRFSTVVRLVVKLVKNRVFELEPGYFKLSKTPPSSSLHVVLLKRQNLTLQNVALPSNFSSKKLSNEIKFFDESPILSGSDLSQIIANISKYNMTKVLPEFFKLLQLALAVPRRLYNDPTIPAVHRISAYIEGKRDVNSADALIWMEKEFLTKLQKDENFHGKVTDRVLSITKSDSYPQPYTNKK